MSGYGDWANEVEQSQWIAKWVPDDDPVLEDCPKKFRDQYRFTVARARSADAEVKALQDGIRNFHDLIRRVVR